MRRNITNTKYQLRKFDNRRNNICLIPLLDVLAGGVPF